MSQQPELTSTSLAAGLAPLPGASSGAATGSAADSVTASEAPSPLGQDAGYGSIQIAETAPISAAVLAPPGVAVEVEAHPQRIPRWLERSELFLRVLLRMYIGLAICYAPWSRLFWDQNPLFVQYPTLSIFAANGAVRGIVSGLGLLNLWIAFQDAFRRENRG
jgi:hypothetical protein